MNQSIVQPGTSPYCKPFLSSSTKKTENDASNITYSSEDEIIKKFKKDLEKSESDISAISTKATFGEAKVRYCNILMLGKRTLPRKVFDHELTVVTEI